MADEEKSKKAWHYFKNQDYHNAAESFEKLSKQIDQHAFGFMEKLAKRLSDRLVENPILKGSGHSVVNKYFDCIYLVNLEDRRDKLYKTTRHLIKFGVDFKLIKAVNGSREPWIDYFKTYLNQPVGGLKRFKYMNGMEKFRGRHFIESAGAVGYIETYKNIIKDAIDKKFRRILILEDDVILSKNFENDFLNLIKQVGEDWKIIQLGASQYCWDSVDLIPGKQYYYPMALDTCGSFAMCLDQSILQELLENISFMEAPFDHIPIGELYIKYYKDCYVSFPNIVIPDVSESDIRQGREQYKHSDLMRWQLKNFNYPLNSPKVGLLVSSKKEIELLFSNGYVKKFKNFELAIFIDTADGLRPVHSLDCTDFDFINTKKNNKMYRTYGLDYLITPISSDLSVVEFMIEKFLYTKLISGRDNFFKELEFLNTNIVDGRSSVIITTCDRGDTIENAIRSVAMQDYSDLEIIVVNDEVDKDDTQLLILIDEISSEFNRSILYKRHAVKRNASAARNTGLLIATGEFISFLDDDDIYLDNRISHTVSLLSASDRLIGAIYCGYIGWNSKQNNLGRYKNGSLLWELISLDFPSHYICTNTVTYKRIALDKINYFDETFIRHQDLELNIRFFECYNIDTCNEILVELNPKPAKVSYKIYDLDFFNLKIKFLHKFKYIIDSFDRERLDHVYDKHWEELAKFISNKDDFLSKIITDKSNGYIQLLLKLRGINFV